METALMYFAANLACHIALDKQCDVRRSSKGISQVFISSLLVAGFTYMYPKITSVVFLIGCLLAVYNFYKDKDDFSFRYRLSLKLKGLAIIEPEDKDIQKLTENCLMDILKKKL